MRAVAIAIVLAATLGGRAAAQLPFEGTWANAREICANTLDNAPADARFPVTLTATRLSAGPFSCGFKSVLPGGASFRVDAACAVGGQNSDEFFTFAVLSGKLYWSWGGRTAVLERCPDRR
ncbi:MAG: hypothetical protein JO047_15715 [Alphaproteobacteria bacterium]|nr:hypothetical protein [Alphaproteobacteria bacterium]